MEVKHLRMPRVPAVVVDEQHQPVTNLSPYVGRQIKRATRKGNQIVAIVEGKCKGERGVILVFASPHDFESCVGRSLRPARA
jgi:hypothetical protein